MELSNQSEGRGVEIYQLPIVETYSLEMDLDEYLSVLNQSEFIIWSQTYSIRRP